MMFSRFLQKALGSTATAPESARGKQGHVGQATEPDEPLVVPEYPAEVPGAAQEGTAAGASAPVELIPDVVKIAEFQPRIIEVLQTIYDPEIPVNIFDMGLIYDIVVDAESRACITMTLTAPGCPAAQSLPVEVREKTSYVPGLADVRVDVVWEPPWSKDMMSEAAKLQLGLW